MLNASKWPDLTWGPCVVNADGDVLEPRIMRPYSTRSWDVKLEYILHVCLLKSELGTCITQSDCEDWKQTHIETFDWGEYTLSSLHAWWVGRCSWDHSLIDKVTALLASLSLKVLVLWQSYIACRVGGWTHFLHYCIAYSNFETNWRGTFCNSQYPSKCRQSVIKRNRTDLNCAWSGTHPRRNQTSVINSTLCLRCPSHLHHLPQLLRGLPTLHHLSWTWCDCQLSHKHWSRPCTPLPSLHLASGRWAYWTKNATGSAGNSTPDWHYRWMDLTNRCKQPETRSFPSWGVCVLSCTLSTQVSWCKLITSTRAICCMSIFGNTTITFVLDLVGLLGTW